ncbi:MAG TPA: GLPGLI family protein [Bacteroidales bacterium]|nr:GLPGLI family protein [Bacteroidales bacterium]
MRKLLFATVFLVLAGHSKGQQSPVILSGRIIFEEKARIELKIDGDTKGIANALPKERKSEKILTFNDDATLFVNGVENAEDEMMQGHSGNNVRVRMIVSSGENKIYTDLKKRIITEQRDFMNRIFLVERKMPDENWKISGEQKVILGYRCLQASMQDTSGTVIKVWFTPDIKISSGPAGLGNLPGMILEADISNGARNYTAISIHPAEDVIKIEKPKEGKEVTESEYKKIVAQKMEEMDMEQGGNGEGAQMQIIIRHQ